MAELTDQSSYLTSYTEKSEKYQTTRISTKIYPVKRIRNDSKKSEEYTEKIFSTSEEEENEAISPINTRGLVKILESVMLNKARIMKKSKFSTKRDPTLGTLNSDSAKRLKNLDG